MTRVNHSVASRGAAGTCRKRRRRQGGRRPEWVRSYRRAQAALDSAERLVADTIGTIAIFRDRVERHPVRTARRLDAGLRWLTAAGRRLVRASSALAEARECLAAAPQPSDGDAPEIVQSAAERWQAIANCLDLTVQAVASRQVEVYAGLICGELVPEHPSDSRPRITLAPRPAPVRAFLRVRLPRAADRISPILRRRRRTRRPAALAAPPRTSQGRAPPSFSSAPSL